MLHSGPAPRPSQAPDPAGGSAPPLAPMSIPGQSSAPNPSLVHDETNWDNLAERLHSNDKTKIDNWNAAIDTLLVLVSFI